MTKTINNISYVSRVTSTAMLIEIPKEGQTPLAESQDSINARSYELSERNGANAYIISTDKDKVYLNFIGQKVIVDDQVIHEILQPKFEYFLEEVIPSVDPFVLADGLIFRCVSADSVPLPKEAYEYFIMMNGVAKKIPDYKTLEVMLAERGQNLLSVRVLEAQQCSEISNSSASSPNSAPITSKASSWTQDYADTTTLEKLKELENNAKAAEELMDSAKAEAAAQIATVQAQAEAAQAGEEAAQAQAQAAQAQAAAAQAASATAQTQAQAAIANAEAAQAAANAAQAAAELAQAELEAQQNDNSGS